MNNLIPYLIEWLKRDSAKKAYVWTLALLSIVLLTASTILYKQYSDYAIALLQGASYTFGLSFIIWLLIKVTEGSTDLREQADIVEGILKRAGVKYNNSWDSTRIDRADKFISDKTFSHYIPLTKDKWESYGIWLIKDGGDTEYKFLYWDDTTKKSKLKPISLKELEKNENIELWKKESKDNWKVLESLEK